MFVYGFLDTYLVDVCYRLAVFEGWVGMLETSRLIHQALTSYKIHNSHPPSPTLLLLANHSYQPIQPILN